MNTKNGYFIELTQGQQTLVDEKDFAWLSQWKWYAVNFNEERFRVE